MVRLANRYDGSTGVDLYPPRVAYIEVPVDSDEFMLFRAAVPLVIQSIYGRTDSGTVTFNVERRSAPGTSGTDAMASDLTATTSGVEVNAFSYGVIPAGQWLYYVASATSGSPTIVWVSIEYRLNA